MTSDRNIQLQLCLYPRLLCVMRLVWPYVYNTLTYIYTPAEAVFFIYLLNIYYKPMATHIFYTISEIDAFRYTDQYLIINHKWPRLPGYIMDEVTLFNVIIIGRRDHSNAHKNIYSE